MVVAATTKCFVRNHDTMWVKIDWNQIGRSYGRVIVYCSNFERTTADALFFESLLCLARMVVAAAVAEPSLASEVGRVAGKASCPREAT